MSAPSNAVFFALVGVTLGMLTIGKVLRWGITIYLLFRTEQGEPLTPKTTAVTLALLGSGLWFGVAAVVLLALARNAPWADILTMGFLIGAIGWGAAMLRQVRRIQLQKRGSHAA